MKTARFEVLSQAEVERIHATSMEILAEVGVKVDYKTARDIFRDAGAQVDDARQCVRLPEKLVRWALDQAPRQFDLYGIDADFKLQIGGGQVNFAGLGTPTHIIDMDSGQRRPATREDMERHIILVDGCEQIHNSQMDVWPNDIPMTTIHVEAIWSWAHHSRKPFGMGCYGYLPTRDMMRMMALAVGGKDELRQRPRFFAICSVVSPLQMSQMQLEGLLLCADYGQPLAMSPEAIAGATAPVTLAGLLAQQNANILAHVTLAQIFRPGTPVLYGTVSTIANLRLGNVALGAVETGLISAGAAQLARYYGLPCRSVGGTTEAKLEDVQAGIERTATLMQAVLAGVDFITCAGTLDSTMLESDALLLLDDELCAAALRVARGIEVNEGTLALDLIRKVNFSGHYLAEAHTVEHFRNEHYIPSLLPREPYETWEKGGGRTALDHARQRVRKILEKHQPRAVDPALEKELDEFRQEVAARTIEEFYAGEQLENQDFGTGM
ncbi:MAG: trimethylamine methyltransferase family protein [Anaerolineales bacterium]|nr:trimethylamine methyltransferase family protein [Anaerolineales bacterium]